MEFDPRYVNENAKLVNEASLVNTELARDVGKKLYLYS